MDSDMEAWTIVGAIIVFLLVVYYIYYFSTTFTNESITVKNDFVKTNGKYSSNMIGTTDGKVYKIASNVLIGFFKSSEVLATLEEGKTFLISGYGKARVYVGDVPDDHKSHTGLILRKTIICIKTMGFLILLLLWIGFTVCTCGVCFVCNYGIFRYHFLIQTRCGQTECGQTELQHNGNQTELQHNGNSSESI